jgi:predicted dehydrogenase
MQEAKRMGKIRVAIVGLGFGAEFIPIYQKHADAECVALCRRNRDELNRIADGFGIEKRYTRFEELLEDQDIDAIHINSPIADHARMSIMGLEAGKHVACTVPMATTVEESLRICELEEKTGKVYMMMETAVYTREYLYVKSLYNSGEMGKIQFLRGSHQQNMSLPGWPEYWYGMPPMHYATHAVSPLLDLIGKRVESVSCIGSGRIESDYIERYGSPFAIETAHLWLKDSDVTCEVTRSLFNTIRQYRESFDVYGTKQSFEWSQLENEDPVVYSGYEDAERRIIPDTDGMLPAEIADFAKRERIVNDQHVSYIQGAGHGGSHPHLVHEFVSAIKSNRKAHVSAAVAANWTMAGILAHESAMKDGVRIEVPG